MSIIDFMVEVEEELKVKEGDLTIDMNAYGGYASVQASIQVSSCPKGSPPRCSANLPFHFTTPLRTNTGY